MADNTAPKPSRGKGALIVSERPAGGLWPYWECKWRNAEGDQVKRRLGPAYLIGREWDPDYRHAGHGEKWRARWIEPLTRAGRPKAAPAGLLNMPEAELKMAEVIAHYELNYASEREEAAKRARIKANGIVTLEDVGAAWLRHAQRVKGMRASTLDDHRFSLRQIVRAPEFRVMPKGFEWGGDVTVAQQREVAAGWSPKPVDQITASDVRRWRDALLDDGASPRTANKLRQLMSSILGYAAKSDEFEAIEHNCVLDVEKVKERRPGRIDYYEPNEVEHLARILREGKHRKPAQIAVGKRVKGRKTVARKVSADEARAMRAQDMQDAALVTVLAFAGLRLGEGLALRWKDVGDKALAIWRSYSGGEEGPTKSGREREVPKSDQVALVLAELGKRKHFTGRDDLVFPGEAGGFLDASALRRRYKAACEAAGLRPLRLHDLRHGFLSQAATEFAPQDVQRLGGHADVRTTARYLHSKSAPDEAARLTKLFATGTPAEFATADETAPAR